MPAYRLTDPNPAYVNLLGTDVAPGGTLRFYDIGTTDPRPTYSDFDLTTPNDNPVELDASGRAENEIWMDGDYTVVLRDADDNHIWTRDVRPEVPPTTGLPDPTAQTGRLLASDGTQYVLVDRLELPDPTGSASYMTVVNSDGTGYILQPQPEIVIPEPPEPDIVVTANSCVTGGGGSLKKLEQWGTATIPASGAYQATLAITFPAPFKSGSTPFVTVTPQPGSQPAGPAVPFLASPPTSTGFTAGVDAAESGTPREVLNNAAIGWYAVGVIDAE